MRVFSIETTPVGARRIVDFRQHVAAGTRIYVTSLPRSEFGDIVETCRRLSADGMVPVPHFTARGIASVRMLEERLDRVTSEAGVTNILAIAGSNREISGPFADTISMLETGAFEKYGIRSLGISGHPEDPPGIAPDAVRAHESRKLEFARTTSMEMHIVTHFVFEAAPLRAFIDRIRAAGNPLPVVIGLPGPATIQSLIRYAKACGIGPSLQFMTRRAKSLHKLLTVEAPDRLTRSIAACAAHPDSGIVRGHLFPFGGFELSAIWANAAAAGDIELTADGFTVTSGGSAQAGRKRS